MNSKLFLTLLLIICFANVNAQYKFSSPATVGIELTLTNTSVFKKVFDVNKEAMMKNKVKKISFKTKDSEVTYLYNEAGQITFFSNIDFTTGMGAMYRYEYDASGNLASYEFNILEKDGTKTTSLFKYEYDNAGRMITSSVVPGSMSPFKFNKISYDAAGLPVKIEFQKEKTDKPEYDATIKNDSEGRIISIQGNDGNNMIKVAYNNNDVTLTYFGTLITKYKIVNGQVLNITDDFVSNDFTYNDIGLIDNCLITSVEDKKEVKYIFGYEYYK